MFRDIQVEDEEPQPAMSTCVSVIFEEAVLSFLFHLITVVKPDVSAVSCNT